MKSYKNLWKIFISENTIRYSISKGAIGKKKRREVRKIMKDVDGYVDVIHDYALNFHNYHHEPVKIRDGCSGKEREIIVHKFNEHVIHHMVVYAMMPLLTKGMYKHTYSSIPGRGLHKGMKRIRTWIDNDPKNVKYCLKLDIKKFFNSIDHEILMNKFRKYIHDNKFLKILQEIVDASPNGIPLGFYTSHWFANWLLQPLDHFIKEELHIVHYIRYMDDMILFGSNKRQLHKARKKIEEFLSNLKLKIKDNWQLFRFDYIKNGKHHGRPLDFIGFKFYRDRTILRKNIMLRLTKKARKIEKKGKFTIHDAHQMMSYLGWIDWTDTYKVYTKYVAPYINFKKCRKYISQYDKKQRRLLKELKEEYNYGAEF